MHEPATVPWFDNIPLCHRCGVPCPSCRDELASDLPSEMSTAQAIVCFDAIHEDQDLLVNLDTTMMDLHVGKTKSRLYMQVQCSYDSEKGSKNEQQ